MKSTNAIAMFRLRRLRARAAIANAFLVRRSLGDAPMLISRRDDGVRMTTNALRCEDESSTTQEVKARLRDADRTEKLMLLARSSIRHVGRWSCSAARSRGHRTPSASATAGKQAYRVLAFEDSYAIDEMLTNGGVNTVGEFKQQWRSDDAVRIIAEFAPDVLLLDYFMPPYTGLQVLKMLNVAVREGTCVRPKYVIGMSSEHRCNVQMLEQGADAGLIKFDLCEWSGWRA